MLTFISRFGLLLSFYIQPSSPDPQKFFLVRFAYVKSLNHRIHAHVHLKTLSIN